MSWGQVNSETWPLQGNDKMLKCRFFPKVRVETCHLSQDILISRQSWWLICSFYPILRVIRGNMRSNKFDASNSWCNRDRALGMVPMCFSRTNTSLDMQHDLLGSTRDLTWPWPEVKLRHWPMRVNMYKFRRVSTRGTWCCPNYSPFFLSLDLTPRYGFKAWISQNVCSSRKSALLFKVQ